MLENQKTTRMIERLADYQTGLGLFTPKVALGHKITKFQWKDRAIEPTRLNEKLKILLV